MKLQIKELREARGWNQTVLGYHARLSPSQISLIETGKRNPSAETLQRIATALGVEVGELFPKDEAPTSRAHESDREDRRKAALRALEGTAEDFHTGFAYRYNEVKDLKEPLSPETVLRFEVAINVLATHFFNFLEKLEREGLATLPSLREPLLATLEEAMQLCTNWLLKHSSRENAQVTHLNAKRRQHAEELRQVA